MNYVSIMGLGVGTSWTRQPAGRHDGAQETAI